MKGARVAKLILSLCLVVLLAVLCPHLRAAPPPDPEEEAGGGTGYPGARKDLMAAIHARRVRVNMRDDERAIKLVTRVAESGDAVGKLWLALFRAKGWGRADRDEKETQALAKSVFEKAKAAAGKDDACALAIVGTAYLEGLGVEKDASRAVKYFERGVDLGDFWSMESLAYLYLTGDGAEKDPKRALVLYRKGADMGDPIMLVRLATCYAQGTGVTRDDDAARKLFREAADAGCSAGMAGLAQLAAGEHRRKGSPELAKEALAWYRKAADAGHAMSMRKIAEAYDDKYHQNQPLARYNRTTAVEWFLKASRAGDPIGMTEHGIMLQLGKDGFREDNGKAVQLFARAARGGSVDAMHRLARAYETGNGTAYSQEKANVWFERAARLGYGPSAHSLGEVYEYGRCVLRDRKKALESYLMGVTRRTGGSCANDAGKLYQQGVGVEQNIKKALDWYRKAEDRGSWMGMFNLGAMYEHGIGVERSDKQAFGWYEKARGSNNYFGMVRLAHMYAHGWGTARDPKKADELYAQALNEDLPNYKRYLAFSSWARMDGPVFRSLGEELEGAIRWADSCFYQGHVKDAWELYNKALKTAAGNREAERRIYERIGDMGLRAPFEVAEKVADTMMRRGMRERLALAYRACLEVYGDAGVPEAFKQHIRGHLGDFTFRSVAVMPFSSDLSKDQTRACLKKLDAIYEDCRKAPDSNQSLLRTERTLAELRVLMLQEFSGKYAERTAFAEGRLGDMYRSVGDVGMLVDFMTEQLKILDHSFTQKWYMGYHFQKIVPAPRDTDGKRTGKIMKELRAIDGNEKLRAKCREAYLAEGTPRVTLEIARLLDEKGMEEDAAVFENRAKDWLWTFTRYVKKNRKKTWASEAVMRTFNMVSGYDREVADYGRVTIERENAFDLCRYMTAGALLELGETKKAVQAFMDAKGRKKAGGPVYSPGKAYRDSTSYGASVLARLLKHPKVSQQDKDLLGREFADLGGE